MEFVDVTSPWESPSPQTLKAWRVYCALVREGGSKRQMTGLMRLRTRYHFYTSWRKISNERHAFSRQPRLTVRDWNQMCKVTHLYNVLLNSAPSRH